MRGGPFLLLLSNYGVFLYIRTAVRIFNNYSMSPRWMRDGKWPKRRVAPSWLLTISYPTRANGITVLVNSQPSVLLNFKNFVSLRFVVRRRAKETINGGSSMNFIDGLI